MTADSRQTKTPLDPTTGIIIALFSFLDTRVATFRTFITSHERCTLTVERDGLL
jgi:hypothetical protein